MPITLKPDVMRYRDPEDGTYKGVDVIAERTTSEQVAELQSAGTTQVNRVTAAGTSAVAHFPETADACDTLSTDFAPVYVGNQAYHVGDLCTYQYQLYQCTVEIPANQDATFVPGHWAAYSVSNVKQDLNLSSQTIDESIYDLKYLLNSASGQPTLIHAGIDIHTGVGMGSDTPWGVRSATSAELIIPPSGIRISMEAGNEPWVFGIWCYSVATFGPGDFVYSPSNKNLIAAGQSVVILPRDGAKYLRVQVRCKSTDPADAAYGGYRPLMFEGETGVPEGEGDDLVIQSLFSYYLKHQDVQQSYNLISPQIYERAKAQGIVVDGEKFSGDWSVFRKLWYWIEKQSSLDAGTYTLSFDYRTGTISSGYITVGYIYDNVTNRIIQPSRSSEWRHITKTFVLPSNDTRIFCFFDSDLQAEAQIEIKNIQIVEGSTQKNFIKSTTQVDNIARNDVKENSQVLESSDNLFDLGVAYANMQGYLMLENGVLTGTNTDFKSIWLCKDSTLGGKPVEITFESKKLTSIPEDSNKIGIVFLDATDTIIERVELTTPPSTYFRPYFVYRVAPEGAVSVRFSEYMNPSQNVFQVRKIRVRINSGSRISSTDVYEKIPPALTSIDTVARGPMFKTASLHDGAFFRLEDTPSSVSRIGYNDLIDSWDAFIESIGTNEPIVTITDEGKKVETDIVTVEKIKIAESTPPDSDPSEIYDIFRYVFTPFARKSWTEAAEPVASRSIPGYYRTVFVTSGCHGAEIEGYMGLLQLMKTIYGEGYRYPTLRKLANNVRFVIIPSWNPYAVQHFQRYSANNSVYPANSPYHYFGTENPPGEARCIIDTLDLYEGQLSCWLDCHTNPYAGSENPRPSAPKDQYKLGSYAFAGNDEMGSALYELTCDFANLFRTEYDFPTKNNFEVGTPGTTGHPAYGLSRLPTAVLEICTKMIDFPYASGSGGMMKLAVEWYGNCLAEAIRATQI